jgi:hypothetical protein
LIKLIGENLGLFAVGKQIVFIEGESSSIDKLTYHAIAQKYLPEAKITPIGSVENIIMLSSVEEAIRKSIFGINFYMVRDRDGLSESQIQNIEKNGKIKCLKKRHIENYFLDSEILYKVVERLCLTAVNPSLNKDSIENEIKRIAAESLNYNLSQNIKEHIGFKYHIRVPTVKSVENKSLDEIKNEVISNMQSLLNELTGELSKNNLEQWISDETVRLQNSLQDFSWKDRFHGKFIFSKLCSDVLKDDLLKIRQAYVEIALEEKPKVFKDIIEIFKSFNS